MGGSCPAASDPSARHAVPHELQAQRHDCARNRRGICPCMAASCFCHRHRGGLVDRAVLGLTGCRDRHRRRNRNELFFNGAAEPDLNGYKLAGFRQGACSRHSARGHNRIDRVGCGKPPTRARGLSNSGADRCGDTFDPFRSCALLANAGAVPWRRWPICGSRSLDLDAALAPTASELTDEPFGYLVSSAYLGGLVFTAPRSWPVDTGDLLKTTSMISPGSISSS